jgi:hypothetical protein
MAGFDVSINGRIWVSTEGLPTHPRRLIAQLTPRGWAEALAADASA